MKRKAQKPLSAASGAKARECADGEKKTEAENAGAALGTSATHNESADKKENSVPLRQDEEGGGVFKVVRRGKKRKAEEGKDATDKMDTDFPLKPTRPQRPSFAPVKREKLMDGAVDTRKIPVPAHRYTPLKENWMKIFTPVVDHLHLQVRFNLKTRNVEIRSCKQTEDIGALQKAADFVKAFVVGFEVEDALALVRLDDLFLESFEIQDVKPLKGDHLSRAIGRIAGKNGKTKFTIENVTKTRVVLANNKIHILGSYQNIQVARRAICNLILGSPPSKVYGSMRALASRMTERF